MYVELLILAVIVLLVLVLWGRRGLVVVGGTLFLVFAVELVGIVA